MKGKLLIKKTAVVLVIAGLVAVQTGGAFADEEVGTVGTETEADVDVAVSGSAASQEIDSSHEILENNSSSSPAETSHQAATTSLASEDVQTSDAPILTQDVSDAQELKTEKTAVTLFQNDSAEEASEDDKEEPLEDTKEAEASEDDDAEDAGSSDEKATETTTDNDTDSPVSEESEKPEKEDASKDTKESDKPDDNTPSDESDKKSDKDSLDTAKKDSKSEKSSSDDNTTSSESSSKKQNNEESDKKGSDKKESSSDSSEKSSDSKHDSSDSSNSKKSADSTSLNSASALAGISSDPSTASERTETSSLTDMPTFTDTSLQRYSKYQQYSKTISSELQKLINELTVDYNARIEMIATFLEDKGKEYKVMQMTPVFQDDSGQTVKKGKKKSATVQKYIPKEIKSETIPINNWGDILAVFVARSTLNVDEPLDLLNLKGINWNSLRDILYEMNTVTYSYDKKGKLELIINSYSYNDSVITENMTRDQIESLEELMQPEFQSVFASVTGNNMFRNLSQKEIKALKAALPRELALEDNSIVSTALSLVGKVNYFWGGKYNQLGMNPEWGSSKVVTASGSDSTGMSRSYGLDCSGFVTWVFINASKNIAMGNAIGNGTADQWSKSYSVGWDEGQLGDLCFLKVPGNGINHVGIIVAINDDGSYNVAHCSSSGNNVIVTEAWATGFRYIRRPYVLG